LPYDKREYPEPENKLILDTLIFNTFVFLQLFNEFNSRLVVADRHNPFFGMHKNYVFNIIFVVTGMASFHQLNLSPKLIYLLLVGLQILVVQYGGEFLETRPLHTKYWGISIGFGASSLVVGIIGRFIPIDRMFPKKPSNKPDKKITEITPLLG
jgi:P-type Ca2+ transporter type 2C